MDVSWTLTLATVAFIIGWLCGVGAERTRQRIVDRYEEEVRQGEESRVDTDGGAP